MTRPSAVRHMFPGGNTSRGFHSFFGHLVGPDARRVFILKGGPGSGKSTFMKRIAEHLASLGIDAEYHHCSADPESVDAVVFPAPGIAVLDGTAPHVIDPRFPGLADEIVDLGRFSDDEALRPHAGEIRRLADESRQSFQRAYKYLAAANAVRDVEKNVNRRAVNEAFLHRQTQDLVEAVLAAAADNAPGKRGAAARPGRRRLMFAGAITPLGPVNHLDTLAAGLSRVFVVRGRPGTGASEVVSKVADAVTDRGWDAELFYCPLDPHRLEHVVIPAAGVAVFTSRPPHVFEPAGADVIDLNEGLSLSEAAERRAGAARRTVGNLFGHAVTALQEARKYHLQVERLYRPAMDFERIERLRSRILERILHYASN